MGEGILEVGCKRRFLEIMRDVPPKQLCRQRQLDATPPIHCGPGSLENMIQV